jgi:hypothetical protein
MHSLPVLAVNDVLMVESSEINRFLGEEYGLSGINFVFHFILSSF